MKLYLLSNSTIPGQGYMEWAMPYIRGFIGNAIKNIAFIPYAGVTVNWNDYEAKVASVFKQFDCSVKSVHHNPNPSEIIEKADAIAVGGGNTFRLLDELQKTGVLALIRKKAIEGVPFIGWSAGSNVACPTIRTTNDMPIIQPASFDAMNLVSFQINPHYLDVSPAGHGGETREDRIREFLEMNRDITVVGLREATLLEVTENKILLKGDRKARIFHYGKEPIEISSADDLSFLLKR